MIPQDKNDAVIRGLHEAFRVTAFDEIHELTISDVADLVFRIVVQGSSYLLRIVRRVADPTCHFECMKAAAETGLAPRVWYTSVPDKISITDFVEARPFPPSEAVLRMPAALRMLHALPPFLRRADHLNTSCTFLLNEGPARDGFLEKFETAKILSNSERDELFAAYSQVAAAYRRDDRDMVSSHNDLFKPDNILFDGQRVWLVDWEAAFLNDRYADLAVLANLVVSTEEEEAAYLYEYFEEPPDEYRRARFFLMQQVSHMFYAMAFLWLGSSGKAADEGNAVPEFRDMQRRIWAGEINVRDKEVKIVYGRAHLQELLRNVQQARFSEALRIVAEGNKDVARVQR